MSQLYVFYESDDGSLLGYSSTDSEIENGHQSVYNVECSTEASSILVINLYRKE